MKPNKAKPAAKKSEISRAQIVDAAALLFRDQGYAATTIRQIAGSIGMQAGSVYYYFNSKDDILNEILLVGERSVMESVRAHEAASGPDASYRKRIECAIEGHLRALLEKSVYSSAYIRVYGQLPEDIKRLHRRRRNAYSKLWDELFTAAQAHGEIRPDISIVPLRLFVLGALNWTVEWFDPEIHSVDMLVDRTALFIFEGIGVSKRRHRKQPSSRVKSDSNSETET